MKALTWLLAVLVSLSLLTALGTGLGMRTLAIWAFQVHKVAGIVSVILGLGMALWVVLLIPGRKRDGNTVTPRRRTWD